MRRQTEIDKLSKDERDQLVKRLLLKQDSKSYISGKIIDLSINKIEIDHIVSLDKGGLDNESNWGIVIDTENSSKGNRDLQLLRYIYTFRQHSEHHLKTKRDFNFGHALNEFFPNRPACKIKYNEDRSKIFISYFDNAQNIELNFPLLLDSVDRSVKSFVGMVPFKIINHDSTINPRSIVDLEPLIEEFYNKNPQLFPSLGIIEEDINGNGYIRVFDGQHKAAAQLYIRSQYLFLRVFVNIDKEKIKRTNLRAHTIVAQIRFPQLVSDKVGHDLFKIEFEPFFDKIDLEKESEQSFIKKEEINDEYRNYLKNYYRYKALIDDDGETHKILDYVETISSRSKKFPLSYDTLSKTFLKLIFSNPSDIKLKESISLRNLELKNLKKIMSIFVEEVLENKFDIEKGIFKLEERLKEDPDSVTIDHLIAYRMCRQSAFIIWIDELQKAIALLIKSRKKYSNNNWSKNQTLWAELSDEEFSDIRKMLKVIKMNSIWQVKQKDEVLNSLGSTKQSDWKEMLINGKLPGRDEKYFEPLTDMFIYQTALNM